MIEVVLFGTVEAQVVIIRYILSTTVITCGKYSANYLLLC